MENEYHYSNNNFIMRQLILIVEKINYFKIGNFNLFLLINDLNSLINVLNNANFKWHKNINEYVSELEILYSIALEKEMKNFDFQAKAKISNIIEELEDIIYTRLKKIEPHFNDEV